MTIDFYYVAASGPCRAVLMTAKAVGVDLNLKVTSPMNGDTRTPEFVKINPQHCIPTIDDNGFALWESRAIIGYLVDRYGKDDTLYPKDPKKRAMVNQRLHFDIGTLYQRFGDYYYSIALTDAPPDPAKYAKIEEAFTFLDKFLEGQDWVAGSNMTIADISIVSNVATAECVGFEISKYPNVAKWLARAKKTIVDYEGLNQPGLVKYKEMFEKMMSGKK